VLGYRNLKIWQKAYDVAMKVLIAYDELAKKSKAIDILMEQLIRSSSSICANIAEGYGSDTNAEFARYLGIAFKSALETDNWLQLLKGYLKKRRKEFEEIEEDNIECVKMLIAFKKSVQSSGRKKRFILE
jgi:four helix bundle protein